PVAHHAAGGHLSGHHRRAARHPDFAPERSVLSRRNERPDRRRRRARHAAADRVAPPHAALRGADGRGAAAGSPMRIVLLGPPGSGKGTHGKVLSAELGIPLISTGDILREAIAEGTRLGKAAAEDVSSGRLVADYTVLGIIETRLAMPDAAKGYLL